MERLTDGLGRRGREGKVKVRRSTGHVGLVRCGAAQTGRRTGSATNNEGEDARSERTETNGRVAWNTGHVAVLVMCCGQPRAGSIVYLLVNLEVDKMNKRATTV